MHLQLRGKVLFGKGTGDEGQENRLLCISICSFNSCFLLWVTKLLFHLFFFLAFENNGGILSKYSESSYETFLPSL